MDRFTIHFETREGRDASIDPAVSGEFQRNFVIGG
jgi:hypothetical protein